MLDLKLYEVYRKSNRNVCYVSDNSFVKVSCNENDISDERFYSNLFIDKMGGYFIQHPLDYGEGYIVYPRLYNYNPIDLRYIDEQYLELIMLFLNIQSSIQISSKKCMEIARNHSKSQIDEFEKNVELLRKKTVIPKFVECGYQKIFGEIREARLISHGDFGHTNILVNEASRSIKIVDYEYFMFAPQNFDLARLYSSSILKGNLYICNRILQEQDALLRTMVGLHMINGIVYSGIFDEKTIQEAFSFFKGD